MKQNSDGKPAQAGGKKNRISAFHQVIKLDPTLDTCEFLYGDPKIDGIVPHSGKRSELMPRLAEKSIHPDDRENHLQFWNEEVMRRLIREEEYDSYLTHEYRIRDDEGRYQWEQEMVFPIREEDGHLSLLTLIRSFQYQKELESGDNAMAHVLLPDRQEFFRRASLYLEDHRSERNVILAVDIRNFRLYNELFGRLKGNERLETIDRYIRECLFPGDPGVAGYLGGDNFCVLHSYPEGLNIEEYIKKRHQEIMEEFQTVRGFALMIGIYDVQDVSDSVHYMYDCAISAVADIRGDMSRTVASFDEAKHGKQLADQRLLLNALEGLRQGEFMFYLQPQCEVETGKIIGAEALARWYHDGELISPGAFIPVLEEYGYVTMLDQFIWEEVMRWQRSLLDRGEKALPCSVNVSRADFFYVDVANTFVDLLDRYQIPPELIKIEITESTYAEDLKQIVNQAELLKARGMSVMLDDFGTGYSSLEMLNEMKFDLIKADMKFMQMGQEGYELVGFILNTANMVGVPVVSEGVETEENVEELKKRGCEYAQGFYYYRPLPVAEYEKLLHRFAEPEKAVEK